MNRYIILIVAGLLLGACQNNEGPALKKKTEIKANTLRITAGVESSTIQPISLAKKSQARAIVWEDWGDVTNLYTDIEDSDMNLTCLTLEAGKKWNRIHYTSADKYQNYDPSIDMGNGYIVLDQTMQPAEIGSKLAFSYSQQISESPTGDYNDRDLLFNSNQFACLIMGGIPLSSGSYDGETTQVWGYGGRTANYKTNLKNQEYHAITDSEKIHIPFPVMTQAIPLTVTTKGDADHPAYDDRVASLKDCTLNPRGLVFAIDLTNLTKYKIKIKSLKVVAGRRTNPATGVSEEIHSPFSFEGEFRAGAIDFSNPKPQDIPFHNTDNTLEPTVFPVYTGADNQAAGITIESSGYLFARGALWGYPQKPNQPLYLQALYWIYDDSGTNVKMDKVYESNIIRYLPVGGWKEGKIYLCNLEVNPITEYFSDLGSFEGYTNGGGFRIQPNNVEMLDDVSTEND